MLSNTNTLKIYYNLEERNEELIRGKWHEVQIIPNQTSIEQLI